MAANGFALHKRERDGKMIISIAHTSTSLPHLFLATAIH